MESSYKSILESFPLISVTMPYYGFTDEIFYVLSSLSINIRKNLMNYYLEFRKFMFKFMNKKDISIRDLSEMKIPLDLFKVNLYRIKYDGDCEYLVVFINKLINKEGKYFGQNYMNEQICISRLYVNACFIKDLYPHIESLKVIKALSNKNEYYNQEQLIPIINLIMLRDIFWIDNGILKICYFDDSDRNKINPIFESFKKVERLIFDKYEYSYSKLELLKMVNIDELETLDFNGSDIEYFEDMTNPEYFNYRIQNLIYTRTSCENVTDLTLNNISKINLQDLYLAKLSSISNFARIFSCLSNCIKVTLNYYFESNLKFKDTDILLTNKEHLTNLTCKEIEFKFSKIEKSDIIFLKNNISITYFGGVRGKSICKQNKTDITADEELPITYNENNTYIQLPKNKLKYIKLSLEQISCLFENDINKTHFASLSSDVEIIIGLKSISDLAKFDQLSEFIPSHSEIEFDDSQYYTQIADENSYDNDIIKRIATKFKINKLEIHYIECADEIMKLILPITSVQNSLKSICIIVFTSSDLLSILFMLADCKMLESVQIYYTHEENEECIEKIDIAKEEIKHKCKNIMFIEVEKYVEPILL